jgi:Na+-translocating ferredoxin:NAD+ oxidoreductase RnfC subunit
MAKLELEIIKNAGVVGAGGAGFPTHVKLDSKV